MMTWILAAWMLSSWVSAAGELAYSQKQWPLSAKEENRSDLAVAVFFSLVPIAGPLALAIETGMFMHGFNWTLSRPSKQIAKSQPEEFKFWWKEPWR